MNLLPWNNPLVGTAFMLRARRGNMLINITLYIMVLVMGYVGWQYYLSLSSTRIQSNPNNIFLRILFGMQCFLSGIVMLGQAGNSLKNEVMNKTLDFQRIAATGPWDIIMGKLLGMPVIAYLLALAAIPVAVFTLANGVAGISFLDLLLMWLQLLTFLFLLGSCAIQNTLQITSTRGTGAAPGFGIFMAGVGMLTYVSFDARDAGHATAYLMDPQRMTLAALFSPLTAYAGIAAENPWAAKFYWFNFEIPCLLLTPIAHIVIAWFFLSIMARRLENVDNTPLGKKKSYLFLFLADLILAGVLHACRSTGPTLGAAGMTLQQRVAVFLLIHQGMSIIYLVTLTPRADLVMSWIWRFRSKQSYLLDSLRQDRAPNSVSVMVNVLFAGFGVALLCLMSGDIIPNYDFLLEACLTTAVIIITTGLLYQYLHLVSRKYGSVYLILFFFVLGMIPIFIGAALRQPQYAGLNELGRGLLMSTPFSQPLRWLSSDSEKIFTDLSPYPMIVGYSLASILLAFLTGRWLAARIERVESTKARLLGAQPGQAAVTE
jgi:hypothetical protein